MRVPVTGVMLNKYQLTLNVGESFALNAIVLPTNATNKAVTWSNSDSAIASLNAGVVTGQSAGTTVITVTTLDGRYTASCTVVVIEEIDVPATGDNSNLTLWTALCLLSLAGLWATKQRLHKFQA